MPDRSVAALALIASIADDLPCGVWVAAAADGSFVYSNHAFQEIMGMGPVTDVGVGEYATPYGIYDRDGALYPEHKMPFVRALEERRTVVVDDLVIHRRDGTRVYVRAFGKPMFDDAGAIVHVAIAFFDITREAQAEEARSRAEHRLRQIVAHAPVVLSAFDRTGTLTLVEGRGLERLGMTPAEFLGRSMFELFPEAPSVADGARLALAGEANTYVAEIPQGTYETHLTPLRDGAGEVVGATGVSTDITDRQRMQVQLARAERLASLGMLAAGVAHEVNNPLAFVMTNLELVERELAQLRGRGNDRALASIEERLHDALTGAKRVRGIVGDLKAFSRVDDQPARAIDVGTALESALALAHNEIRHRARLVIDRKGSAYVAADEGRLAQVFLNLLVNAAQAIPEGDAKDHEIRVVSRVNGEEVILEVHDTGAGISPEALPKIFDPFFTTKEIGSGTGLGLAICHAVVTALGGRIEVESTVGRGTTARVVLPTTSERPLALPRSEVTPGPSKGRRGTILVIDDEPLLVKVLCAVLATEHDVTQETSANAALARFRAGERFDVIVCDLMMPQVTGMDLYDALLDIAPEQANAMLFLTGGAFTPRAHAFLDRVTGAVLEKPVDTKALLERVRQTIQQRSSHQEITTPARSRLAFCSVSSDEPLLAGRYRLGAQIGLATK